MTDRTALRLAWLAELALIGVMVFASSILSDTNESRGQLIPLSIFPFVIVLAMQVLSPTGKTWRLISAFHQGMMVVWIALGLIVFVASLFPQNLSMGEASTFLLFCLALVLLQFFVVYLAKRFKSDASENKVGVSFVRVFSVLYSAGLFLILFK